MRDNYQDEDLNKSIKRLSLLKTTKRTLEIEAEFSDPTAITNNILEPDILDLTIILSQVFTDAQTLEELDEGQKDLEVLLQPQFSKEKFQEWLDVAETAANAGTAVVIIEIIICFIAGEALGSMWILVNALQFIVVISTWNINVPIRAMMFFNVLNRVVQGEFIDDLQIGIKIAEGFSIETDDIEGPE